MQLRGGAYWLHVPKTGTSIANLISQWGCAIDVSSSDELATATEAVYGAALDGTEAKFVPDARFKFIRERCNRSFEHDGAHMWYHLPTTMRRAERLGDGLFAMMRAPQPRTASAFAQGMFMCPELLKRHNCSRLEGGPVCATTLNCSRPALVLAYAACVRGCTSRMLSGRMCGRGDHRVWVAAKSGDFGAGSTQQTIALLQHARAEGDRDGLSDASLNELTKAYNNGIRGSG